MVRAVSTRGSRRGILLAFTGSLLAALVPAASVGKKKRGKKGKKGKKAGRGRGCAERCGGQCFSRCPDVMTRNPATCQCDCPEGMDRCGQVCVGDDRCCPGEKSCGGGCIHEDECCPYEEDCCPPPNRKCANETCVPEGTCCPGFEIACPGAERGCCLAAVEECADDGCCPLVAFQAVCDGQCIDTGTDPQNCGSCGVTCDERTEACFDGACRDICSLNTESDYTVACDEGGDYWCCPTDSPQCCRISGNPHCC
jgi:hypothetical protein